MRQCLLFGLGVVLVVLVVVGWGKYISNDQALYTNAQYGYFVRYPKSLPLDAKNPAAVIFGTLTFEPGPGALFITVQEDAALLEQLTTDSSQKCDEITLAQEKATRCVGASAFAGSPESTYIVPLGKNFLSLSYIHGDTTSDKQMEVIIKSLDIKK